MMDFTPLIRPWMVRRARAAYAAAMRGGDAQRETLRRLLRESAGTEAGRRYGFAEITSEEEYRRRVPLHGYEEIRDDVMRMVSGGTDILCPGRVRRYAQSSGTSGGKSKYIPLPDRSLSRCHYRGSGDVVAFYLANNPRSRLFSGRAFILGGSFANELTLPAGVRVGDLSAHLIERIPALGAAFRTPRRDTALLADWHDKLPRLIAEAQRRNVTNISGVPSWFMTVLRGILDDTGARTLHDVWPGLEVFFHGGISFAPYREQYMQMTDPARMHYVETYNASEGFFALQDRPDSPAMLLLTDNDVYYEFIDPADAGNPAAEALGIDGVRPGAIYALVITSSNGLWRYVIGDTVRIETVRPLRITIAGRTQAYINAFGEEVMVFNTDAAIAAVAARHHVDILNYTAGPRYAADGRRAHHEWIIEFGRRKPGEAVFGAGKEAADGAMAGDSKAAVGAMTGDSKATDGAVAEAVDPEALKAFAADLDAELQRLNSDYQAKRAGDIFLGPLTIRQAAPGAFDAWLASTGRLGGQRKVPRLTNTPALLDDLRTL